MSNVFMEDNWFNKVMTRVFDLCLLNLLTFIWCIPVITAGRAVTSMYAVMLKMVKDQEGPIVQSFFKEMKQNKKGSVGLWLLILAGFVLLLFDLSLWTNAQVQYRSLFYGLTVAMVVALSAVSDWYFALRAKFENTPKESMKNAAKFAMVFFPASVLMGAYTIGIVVLLMHFPMFITLVPIMGLAVLMYPKALYIRKKFDDYIEERGIGGRKDDEELEFAVMESGDEKIQGETEPEKEEKPGEEARESDGGEQIGKQAETLEQEEIEEPKETSEQGKNEEQKE